MYAASPGQTRQQALKESTEVMRQRLDSCEELIELLHGQSNSEAIDRLLSRLDFPQPPGKRSRPFEPSPAPTEPNSPASPQSPLDSYEERDEAPPSKHWDPLLRLPEGELAAMPHLPEEGSLQQPDQDDFTPTRRLSFQDSDSASLPLHIPDECLMSKLYLSFRDASRNLIQEGTPAPLILGDLDSVDVTLLMRERKTTDALTVDNWACELLRGLRDAYDSYVLLAWASLLTRFMRVSVLEPAFSAYLNL